MTQPKSHGDRRRRVRIVLLVLSIVAAASLCALTRNERPLLVSCGPWCTTASSRRRQWRHVATVRKSLEALVRAKSRLYDALREDYGDYAGVIFNRTTLQRLFTSPSEKSVGRLRRRMQIKFIQANFNLEGAGGTNLNADNLFIWATGGNSVAAGHGNLFNETYTVVLEHLAKEAFGSVGLDFRARLFGMSGQRSSPEISMCMESIFGKDVDVLMYDYSLTDGRRDPDSHRYSLWGYRTALHRSNPILISRSTTTTRRQTDFVLEWNGLGVINFADISLVRKMLPDSDATYDADSLPRAVRYYMCKGHAESGEPCSKHKFTHLPACPEPKYRVSWHPGWRENRLIGSLLAVFVVDTLVDAIAELGSMENATLSSPETPSPSRTYLQHLHSLEGAERHSIILSQVPKDVSGAFGSIGLHFGSRSFCHTAQLPSQSRFDGLVTQRGRKGASQVGGYFTAFNESESVLFDTIPAEDNATSPILATMGELHDPQECKEEMGIDYHDFFLIQHHEDARWITDVVPNNATKAAFSDGRNTKGIIMMCLAYCNFGSCPEGYIWLEAIADGNVTIAVNDQPVVRAQPLDEGIFSQCYVLLGQDNKQLWGPGTKGQYEMKFRVNVPGQRLFISSIIIL